METRGPNGQARALLWVTDISLRPHMVGGVRELSGVSFKRALISFMRASPSRSNHLPKTLPPDTIILGIRFQHMNFVGWGTNIQSITDLLGQFAELDMCGSSRLGRYIPSTQRATGASAHFTGAQLVDQPTWPPCLAKLGHGALHTYLASGTVPG